jgi:hypothetical protein
MHFVTLTDDAAHCCDARKKACIAKLAVQQQHLQAWQLTNCCEKLLCVTALRVTVTGVFPYNQSL